MNDNEVTIVELAEVLADAFVGSYVTWNSGNFYTIVASNSARNLKRLISKMGRPALPSEYVYEALPHELFAKQNVAR